MSGAICDWCGGYLLDGHDEDECYEQRRHETYQRGAAKAREALAAARAAAKEGR